MSGSGPCASCRKACCANYTVSINGYDAWVIGKGLHLPLESFAIYFPVAEQNDSGFILEPGGSRYEIALDKMGQYRKGNFCVFWVELSNGGGRCGIYPYRPMVCQTYPAYQQQEMVVLRDDVLCPEGVWNLVGMDLPVFRQRLSRFRMDQGIYTCIVSQWNDAVERAGRTFTIREYYTAIMNVYESINRWAEGISREALDDLSRKWGEMPEASPNPLFADTASADDDEQWHSSIAALREQIRRSAPVFAEQRKLAAAAV